MACESEKSEVKAAKEALGKIQYYNQTHKFKKMKELNSTHKRVRSANTALSQCRSKNASEKLKKELDTRSDSTVIKKTGGFRDEWLEPKCCPEI